MGTMCVPNVKISSLWELWQAVCDVSARLKKKTHLNGLARHFEDVADLNLECEVSKASVYAEDTSHSTLEQSGCLLCLLHLQNLHKANNLYLNLGTLNYK
jgi:hypothetical protein